MKKISAITVVIIIAILFGCFMLSNKSKQKEEKGKDMDLKQVQITNFSIQDRVVIKKNNAIYVGNNQKELENDFYDIKIENKQEGIVVYLNKLWYESYGHDYIQDEYLARICRELSYRLNMESKEEQFEYVLYKYIKDNYMKVRQNEQVEKIMTDSLNLEFKLEESIVKLVINTN